MPKDLPVRKSLNVAALLAALWLSPGVRAQQATLTVQQVDHPWNVAVNAAGFHVMDLEAVAKEAAARKRWEFLVTGAPVPVLGGTGFPLIPIATF